METMPLWLTGCLACPRDGSPLSGGPGGLSCAEGHRYPIIDGIPVFLLKERTPTAPFFTKSLEEAEGQRAASSPPGRNAFGVDSFVEQVIVATNGELYRRVLGNLPRYPVPEIRLPPGKGELLLDVGCNWGRWCMSAARRGYRPVGIDPDPDAVRAARRVAKQLGLEAAFVVGDARTLPFRSGAFDVAFSYGVLQHFDKGDAKEALSEMGRATRPGGRVLVQMANRFGLRQAYNCVRQVLSKERKTWRMRYWTPDELKRTAEMLVGPATLSVDGFFSLNPQVTDLDLMPPQYTAVVRISERLRQISERLPMLRFVADSLYVEVTKPACPNPLLGDAVPSASLASRNGRLR